MRISCLLQRAAVIGCGGIGAEYDLNKPEVLRTHAKGYFVSPLTELSYVVDIDKNKAKTIAQRYSCKHLTNIESLPLDKLNIISICTPTEVHFDNLRFLYDSDYNGVILLEKPVVFTVDQLEKLAFFGDDFLNKIFVNYIRRFDTGYAEFIHQMKQGDFGVVKKVVINYYGGFEHNGIHQVNLLNAIFEKEPSLVYKTDDLDTIILRYGDVDVFFINQEKDYLFLDINFYTDRYKVVFDDIATRMTLFKKRSSLMYDGEYDLENCLSKKVQHDYLLNMIESVIHQEKISTVHEGIIDLKFIKGVIGC